MATGGEPRRSRGFFATLGDLLAAFGRAVRAVGLRGIVRGCGKFLRELLLEGALGIVLALAGCAAAFALVWGFAHHPSATAAVAAPVGCLVAYGAVLVRRGPLPYGRLGAAAVAAFGIAAALLYGVTAAGGCDTC
jgi:hypothetical protein